MSRPFFLDLKCMLEGNTSNCLYMILFWFICIDISSIGMSLYVLGEGTCLVYSEKDFKF